jgi:cytosine/creatinine deaminase
MGDTSIGNGQDYDRMAVAVEQARLSLSEGGIPIGAALFRGPQLLGNGHNRRVQLGNPILHGETDCLQNVGRIGTYKGTTMYSTLMPCYMCSGTIVQFRIMRVVVGEAMSFPGGREFMEAHGVEVVDLEMPECAQMMEAFIEANPELWAEDIGEL